MSGPLRPSAAVRWLALLITLALVGLALTPLGAIAQEDPSGDIQLRLVDQSVWHGIRDDLGLRLRVVNRSSAEMSGFLLSLTAHTAVSTRSGLSETIQGNPGAIGSARSERFEDVVEPGDSHLVHIDDPVTSLTSLAGLADGGVYPLTITLSDESGAVEHDRITTPLILYPDEPETPLDLALVLPLNDLPSRGPDGVFRDPLETDELPIAKAVTEEGWLAGLVEALEAEAGELPPFETRVRVKRPKRSNRRGPRFKTVQVPQRGLHLSVAPTPRLLEELADMGDGFRRAAGDDVESVGPREDTPAAARRVVRDLAALLAEEGVQPLLVPYSFPDLPTLADRLPDRLSHELDAATRVLGDALGLELDGSWLFPPAGRMSAETLDEIRFINAEIAHHTFFQPEAFETPTDPPEGCPQAFASFTCPVSVRTLQGRTTGLVSDEGLEDRFVSLLQRSDTRLQLQNFFAETAVIRQELPSVANRVVHVTVPSLWHPRPELSRQLLAGLRDAPWLRTVTPAEALRGRPPVSRSEDFLATLPALRNEPDTFFFEELVEAVGYIDSFRRIQPPEAMVERMRRNTLVAESRLWWATPELAEMGEDYLTGTREAAEQQLRKVTIGGPAEINLTSREGEIPLVISNQAGFPARVRIRITSSQADLELEDEVFPPQQIGPKDIFQLTVRATARSSGIFPMQVVVETPDGSLQVATKQVTIRSTEFNRVALGITLGAFAFLVFFYLMRLVRKPGQQTA